MALWLFMGLSRTGLCIFPGAVFGLDELGYRSIRKTHLPNLNVCDVTHPTSVTLVHYKKGVIYTLTLLYYLLSSKYKPPVNKYIVEIDQFKGSVTKSLIALITINVSKNYIK